MSKWKKIGSVHSGDDNKSNRSIRSRSREEMHTMSFRQNVARMKLNVSDLIDSENTYFCKNYIDRKKQTSSNRSFSRVKTEKSLPTENQPMRSTISKKKIYKDEDNDSMGSALDKTDQPKKYKQFAKQSEIKALKEDHIRLKEYVKFEINSFKAAFKDLENELRFEVMYKKQQQAQKAKSQQKKNSLVPIVPFRFDNKLLDGINFTDVSPKKKQAAKNQYREADINILNQIKAEARLCIDELNQIENERAQIIQKFKDINLEELLA